MRLKEKVSRAAWENKVSVAWHGAVLISRYYVRRRLNWHSSVHLMAFPLPSFRVVKTAVMPEI